MADRCFFMEPVPCLFQGGHFMMSNRSEILPVDGFQPEGLVWYRSGPFDKGISSIDKQHDDPVF